MTASAAIPQVEDADILALEAVAAQAWPAPDTEVVGPWLLRAAEGWTGRANSALPTVVDADLAGWLPAIEDWYRARRLRPMVAVPLPTFAALEATLYAAGWEAGHGGDVLVAAVASLQGDAAAPDGATFEVLDHPDAAWLAAYHHRGGPLPAVGEAILDADAARFARLRVDGETAAICRFVVDGPWAGIAAMEVAPRYRRRGLGRALLRAVADAARLHGAQRLWLQVDPDNHAARTLYLAVGFATHHAYRYVRQAG